MPPRIAYWTSSFEPEMEAIAAEVATLRRHFPGSVSWGLNRRNWASLSGRSGYSVHPRLHLAFRAATRLLEPAFELNHVFGSVGDWFYLEGRRLRPTVLTAAAWTDPVEDRLLAKVDRFVAECPMILERLERLGIGEERLRLIPPPVDLARYVPAAPPDGPFCVLFASSPERADWLDARGVPLIIDAATLRPDVQFRLLWRPWGDSEAAVRRNLAVRNPRNVELVVARVSDMPAQYQRSHAVVAPFTDASRCKPAPNSVIDGLACGRPAIVTREVGLAPLIDDKRAGIVIATDAESLAESIDRLQAAWPEFSSRARATAEQCFGIERFLHDYTMLYGELIQ